MNVICLEGLVQHLNYGHLLYFWTVAKEGSIVDASKILHITPQTISGQLKRLETTVGKRLFQRIGRNLSMTETGRLVFQYADDIFSLGSELAHVVSSGQAPGPGTFNVGVTQSIPKLIAYRLIEPACSLEKPIRIVCREAPFPDLLGSLSVHRLDLVLSDMPAPTRLSVRAYNHLLGESSVSFFSTKRRARVYRRGFPYSLRNAPMLLPTSSSALRQRLDAWLADHDIVPRIIAEFDDSALLKAFGQAGSGLFPGPTAIETEIQAMYHVSVIGRADTVRERFYAISPERKLKHPAVVAITELAREKLFTAVRPTTA